MSDMTLFTVLSTVGAALAIALGVMFPALAMGRAIGSALDALARQPEAEKALALLQPDEQRDIRRGQARRVIGVEGRECDGGRHRYVEGFLTERRSARDGCRHRGRR